MLKFYGLSIERESFCWEGKIIDWHWLGIWGEAKFKCVTIAVLRSDRPACLKIYYAGEPNGSLFRMWRSGSCSTGRIRTEEWQLKNATWRASDAVEHSKSPSSSFFSYDACERMKKAMRPRWSWKLQWALSMLNKQLCSTLYYYSMWCR